MVQMVNLHPLKCSNLRVFLFFYRFSRTHVSTLIVVLLMILGFLQSDVLVVVKLSSLLLHERTR
jgi:hypothetical protein